MVARVLSRGFLIICEGHSLCACSGTSVTAVGAERIVFLILYRGCALICGTVPPWISRCFQRTSPC